MPRLRSAASSMSLSYRRKNPSRPDDVAQRLILRRITTHPFGTANVPTLAVPMGFTSEGLPLSLQIAARPFAEEAVYRIGHAYERATQWHAQHPDLERTLRAFQRGERMTA